MFPLVGGLTETFKDADPLVTRLAEFLAQRPGGSASYVNDALAALTQGYNLETNPKVRAKISDAILDLRFGDAEGEDSD